MQKFKYNNSEKSGRNSDHFFKENIKQNRRSGMGIWEK